MYGDVTAIYRDATLIARYVYDAYGNSMVLDANGQQNFSTTFIGNVNPLKGEPNLPPGAKKALEKLWKDILEALLKWR